MHGEPTVQFTGIKITWGMSSWKHLVLCLRTSSNYATNKDSTTCMLLDLWRDHKLFKTLSSLEMTMKVLLIVAMKALWLSSDSS